MQQHLVPSFLRWSSPIPQSATPLQSPSAHARGGGTRGTCPPSFSPSRTYSLKSGPPWAWLLPESPDNGEDDEPQKNTSLFIPVLLCATCPRSFTWWQRSSRCGSNSHLFEPARAPRLRALESENLNLKSRILDPDGLLGYLREASSGKLLDFASLRGLGGKRSLATSSCRVCSLLNALQSSSLRLARRKARREMTGRAEQGKSRHRPIP